MPNDLYKKCFKHSTVHCKECFASHDKIDVEAFIELWEEYMEGDGIRAVDVRRLAEQYQAEIDRRDQEIARAFTILESYGVTRERARSVDNGIDVLGTRHGKEFALLDQEIADLKAALSASAGVKQL